MPPPNALTGQFGVATGPLDLLFDQLLFDTGIGISPESVFLWMVALGLVAGCISLLFDGVRYESVLLFGLSGRFSIVGRFELTDAATGS